MVSELVYIREVYNKSIAWRMPPTFYQQKNDFSVLNGVLAYSFTPQSVIFSLNLLMLCLIGLIFRLIAFWSLVILSRDERGLWSVSDIVMPYSRFAFFRAQISKLDLGSLFTAVETTSASSLDQEHVTNRRTHSMVHSFSEVESYEPFVSGAQAAAESEAWNRRNGTGTVQVYGRDKICRWGHWKNGTFTSIRWFSIRLWFVLVFFISLSLRISILCLALGQCLNIDIRMLQLHASFCGRKASFLRSLVIFLAYIKVVYIQFTSRTASRASWAREPIFLHNTWTSGKY